MASNPKVSIPRGKWMTAEIRVTKSGVIQAKLPASAVRRKRNIAAGFRDEEGIFHPIRASYDYSGSRAGDPPPKRKKRKPAKRKTAARKRNTRRRY